MGDAAETRMQNHFFGGKKLSVTNSSSKRHSTPIIAMTTPHKVFPRPPNRISRNSVQREAFVPDRKPLLATDLEPASDKTLWTNKSPRDGVLRPWLCCRIPDHSP
jgi:hypothetical protein